MDAIRSSTVPGNEGDQWESMSEVTEEKYVAVPSKERKEEVDLERAFGDDRYPKD